MPQFAQQALALSRMLNEYAEAVRDRGRAQWRADEIDEDDYEEIKRTYNRLRGASRTLAAQASKSAAKGLDGELARLRSATSKLTKAKQRVDRAADIVGVAAQLLAVSAAAVTMIAAPNPASVVAVVVAIEQTVKQVG